jgi:hypothetical protein
MSYAKEMLDVAPERGTLDVEAVAAATDATLTAMQSCTACADADLFEDDVEEMRLCIARCEICSDLCATTARVLSRPARLDHVVLHRLLRACVRQCQLCAEECERHAEHHRHCAICEKACRACEQACSELLETEELRELEKLAGG